MQLTARLAQVQLFQIVLPVPEALKCSQTLKHALQHVLLNSTTMMEAEAVVDAMLYVGHALDLHWPLVQVVQILIPIGKLILQNVYLNHGAIL